jgi:altronate dehydratase large subunit
VTTGGTAANKGLGRVLASMTATESDEFRGFRRADGRVGVRNLVAVIPVSVRARAAAQRLASDAAEWVRATPHQMPLDPPDGAREQVETVLEGVGANPNVAAALYVELGTERIDADALADGVAETGKPAETLTVRDVGGTAGALEAGGDVVANLADEARDARRESADASELVVAMECGGSDATSGMASNPVVGNACDRIVEAGGTGVISETPEFIGAEHILAERCASDAVREKLLARVERRENMAGLMGVDFRGAQPSPGNQKGGLTTLEEKSLGAIAKGGTTPLRDVVGYGHRLPVGGGFVVMDSPGYDVESVSGKVAGGAQLVVFTTGRGSTTGNPIAPVVKVTANPGTYERMQDNMDFDASGVLRGDSVASQGADLYDRILSVADGELTAAERHRMREFAINDVPPNELAELGDPA